ncbi:hypothetical protein EVAR_53928_1 [Eumeta japonica]|uniref:Uncharacterized protein n=1 Tax=Eumeta variegata TaxID=151549 RepID=A0A4C1YNC4_EUMVA|nr:hypothetical protein EVAR_53928_1 [Eumeta japonica]
MRCGQPRTVNNRPRGLRGLVWEFELSLARARFAARQRAASGMALAVSVGRAFTKDTTGISQFDGKGASVALEFTNFRVYFDLWPSCTESVSPGSTWTRPTSQKRQPTEHYMRNRRAMRIKEQ